MLVRSNLEALESETCTVKRFDVLAFPVYEEVHVASRGDKRNYKLEEKRSVPRNVKLMLIIMLISMLIIRHNRRLLKNVINRLLENVEAAVSSALVFHIVRKQPRMPRYRNEKKGRFYTRLQFLRAESLRYAPEI